MPPPPQVSRCRARGLVERPPPRGASEAEGPARVAGRRERGARRPPHNGGHRRPRAAPPRRAPSAARALEGSRTGLLSGGGEGNVVSRICRAAAGTSHSRKPHFSRPIHPQSRTNPSLGGPASPSAAAFPPHSPVDAIFSPSFSFSQRPSPSRFPSRRRTAQARNPQPRALPSGQATGVREGGANHCFLVLPLSTLVLILSKERRS